MHDCDYYEYDTFAMHNLAVDQNLLRFVQHHFLEVLVLGRGRGKKTSALDVVCCPLRFFLILPAGTYSTSLAVSSGAIIVQAFLIFSTTHHYSPG